MKTLLGTIRSAACLSAALAISASTSQAQLVNLGFEDGLTGWNTFGNAYADPAPIGFWRMEK